MSELESIKVNDPARYERAVDLAKQRGYENDEEEIVEPAYQVPDEQSVVSSFTLNKDAGTIDITYSIEPDVGDNIVFAADVWDFDSVKAPIRGYFEHAFYGCCTVHPYCNKDKKTFPFCNTCELNERIYVENIDEINKKAGKKLIERYKRE